MGLLLGSIFLVVVGVIAVSGLFLQAQVLRILAGIENSLALSDAVLATSLLSFSVSVVMLAFLFLMTGRFVARPIRRIAAAMSAFAETGARPAQEPVGWAPSEVKALERAFEGFAGTVAEVHKHDVEISKVKSDFISTAAHQLRTPLTGIRWALEALQLEALTDAQKALVASAVEKSHQLVAVVGTLLDISSIESGKYKYAFKAQPLDPLIAQVTQDFAPMAVTANVSLLYERSEGGNAVVNVDRDRICWVLNNLIENAIRYTPAGGSVRVSTELATGRVYVRIRDTGIGIAASDKSNIFERFYRAPNAIAKENGGNGLGLYIARTVATDHGGDLNFESNVNGPGTTFTLSLPVAG